MSPRIGAIVWTAARMWLALALLALMGCSSPDVAPTPPPECPTGQRDVVSRVTGAHHCVLSPGDYVNVTPGCEPQAVQAYYDWAMFGDGGAGALACSAAGQAVCADDKDAYETSIAQASDAGVMCPFR